MMAAAMPVKLTIVIPSHRRMTDVLPLLRSLKAQRLNPESLQQIEVLWVVNGVAFGRCQTLFDEMQNSMWRNHFQVIYQDQAHANLARNRGARESAGENLFFLDDDLEFPSIFFLKRLLEWIDDQSPTQNWAVGGIYSLGRHTRAGRAYYKLSRRFWSSRTQETFLLAGFMILPRRLFFEIGEFPQTRAWGGSELMINDELKRRGVTVTRDDRLHLIHHLPITYRELIRKGLKQGEGARLMRDRDVGHVLDPLFNNWPTRLYLLAFHMGLRSPERVRQLLLAWPLLLKFHLLVALVFHGLLRPFGLRSTLRYKIAWHFSAWVRRAQGKSPEPELRRWAWVFVPRLILEQQS